MQTDIPFVVMTMGDAGGIGPELIHQALTTSYPETYRPLVVGDARILDRAGQVLQSPLHLNVVRDPDDADCQPGIMNILDVGEPSPESAPFGKVSAASGKGSIIAIQRAHTISLKFPVRAILSAPVNKEAVHAAGYSYVDEAELMNELTGASNAMLILIAENIRMASLPPVHLSVKQACENITAERILSALETMRKGLLSFGIENPVIAVSALNPHGGEGGLFGDEEIRAIIPGVEAGRQRGWEVRGPFPADTLFVRAFRGEFDGILTMYHDQGRTAMKTTHFGQIIIVMIGIPVLFVTPAHGTAYGKAGKGTADPANFIQALEFIDRVKS